MLKTQKTLDDFYKNTKNVKNNSEIKKYFYLIWENKFVPNVDAYWCDERPKKINFIEQVQCNYIKNGYYFYICGYFPDIEEEDYHLLQEKVYKNIPNLKSHLQKCIRKQNDALSVQTCYHLFKMDINELLRRIPIIMLEDVFLHNSFTTLIWIMCAYSTKKFKIKLYIYEWLLGVVYALCKINIKDEIKEKDEYIKNNNISELLNNYNDLKQFECSLLYCMHIRNAYGGMESDNIMLDMYSKIWEKRFRDKSLKINDIQIRPIKIFIKDLCIDDWDNSAIDNHCNSKIIDFINKKYEHISNDELKKLIWLNSSSINTRTKKNIYNPELWNEIKDYVVKTQKYLLKSSY